jgi:hypothetical protein
VVSGWNLSRDVLNPGAEIDLIAIRHPDRLRWSIHGFQDANLNSVTLTSGVQDYRAAVAAGGDIEFSTNGTWTLDELQSHLAYTIPFLLAITHADEPHGDRRSRFYDDNYDDSSSATALATLANSFAHLIDPFDPDNSPGPMLYDVCEVIGNDCFGDPGISTPGVDLLTEYTPEAPAPGLQMQNDDFAARQFLYPFVRVVGDFNGDKAVTIQDIDLLIAEIHAQEPRAWFVPNSDQTIDVADLNTWVKEVKRTRLGDANLDGEFNSADLVAVLAEGKYENGEMATWTQGDWNGDMVFDSGDLVTALSDGGYEQGPPPAATQVPEPTSMALALLSVLGLVGVVRRRAI